MKNSPVWCGDHGGAGPRPMSIASINHRPVVVQHPGDHSRAATPHHGHRFCRFCPAVQVRHQITRLNQLQQAFKDQLISRDGVSLSCHLGPVQRVSARARIYPILWNQTTIDMPNPLNILTFFDARPGHQFQTRGVLSALSALTNVSVRERHVGKPSDPLGEFCPDLLLGPDGGSMPDAESQDPNQGKIGGSDATHSVDIWL